MRKLWVAHTVALALVAGVLAAPEKGAAAEPQWKPSLSTEKSVDGKDFVAPPVREPRYLTHALKSPPKVSWPAKAADVIRVPEGTSVELLHSDTPGIMFSAKQEGITLAGKSTVEVDYSKFRGAYGGDWASRLGLVNAATGERIAVRNNVQTGRLSAEVSLSSRAATFAVTAAPGGSAGDFKATKLSSNSTWEAGGSAGSFTWNYDLDLPPSLGGPEPDLDLSYSSASIDGRVASTNNQAGWVGEGWDFSDQFIERRYESCADEVSQTPKPQDECWTVDNAYMALNGKSTELVRVGNSNIWRERDDNGSRIELLTGASNGDDDGEYWKVTTGDGVQYFFGRHRLPEWVTGKETTNSAWTVPVFGDDAGEPCHGSTFATSWCQQAWRWNLDYVVDPNGNTVSYFYNKETNYYGRNLTASAGTVYTRGGYLKRIDYGQRLNSLYASSAPMRVLFNVEERCAAGATCGTGAITKDTAKNWPDVPYDQNCNEGATCTNNFAPTFWTRKRLASVTTQVLVSGSTYKDVRVYSLGYGFLDPGDGTSPALWLDSITETGKVGGSASLPSITFDGLQLANRVDAGTSDGIPPMFKWRVTDVYDEYGGHTRVNYSGVDCARSSLPAVDNNTRRCFPQYWQADGGENLTLDWFHKYVPVQVLEGDRWGTSPDEQTAYEYLGGGAWHYDDNVLTRAKYRTWGQWRGFGRVRVTKGAAGETRSQTETLYMRGMDGDRTSSGGTKSVSVTDSQGVSIADHVAMSGHEREEIVYNGPGGPVLSATISDPYISAPTATQGNTKAYMTDEKTEREREALSGGGWRVTEKRTTFDSYGRTTQVEDLGDVSVPADDKCTRTTYAQNTDAWLIDFPVREETVGVACATTPSHPADAISDERTFYDGSTTFGTAPSKGDITMTQELASYVNGVAQYVVKERNTYDANGRRLDRFDAMGRKTSVTYGPAGGVPVTTTTHTNPLGHSGSSTVEPAWGDILAEVDVNGRRTQYARDPLGRLTAVWLPDRVGKTPSYKYSYVVRVSDPTVVTTETLNDDETYDVSHSIHDGQMRLRQKQDRGPSAAGGRVVTDVFHDSRSNVVKENKLYWNSEPPSTTLLDGVADATVPNQLVSVHDGAGRETAEITRAFGVEKWRTTTIHDGDRTTVVPPSGGAPETNIEDADGHIVEMRHYLGSAPTGSYVSTRYTYTKSGELATVTDPDGNVWSNEYDLRGRVVKKSDPDSGTTTVTFSDSGQILSTTDSRGKTLAWTYDALDRKTGMYQGSASGTKLAAWTYDTLATGVVVKGKLATSTRYVNGSAYVESVDSYDVGYRPLTTTVTIPAIEGPLSGTYRFNTGYTATGLEVSQSYPAAGGMPAETLRYTYDQHGRITTAQTGLSTLLTDATYTLYGEPQQLTLSGATGKQISQTYFYDEVTGLVNRTLVNRNTSTQPLADITYTRDQFKNVRRIADAASGDVQCFGYDGLERLNQAWTPGNGDCAAAPSAGAIGGPAPYWQSWTYDKSGNRLSETSFDKAAGTSATSTYSYPAPGQPGAHAVGSVSQGALKNTYRYDAGGNLVSRTAGGVTQDFTWDAEAELASITQGGQTTSFVYDADGDRLIKREPAGTTLYLDGMEILLSPSGGVSATRFYETGAATAVRTSAGLYFETDDHHGTALLSIDADDLTSTRRYYLPFGQERGNPAAWPNQHGFVGGTNDASGLIHLGARLYDPVIGRFISVDAVIDWRDPQQMNGYAYANNTPVTASDPDGDLRDYGSGGYTKPKKKKSKKPRKAKKHKKCPWYNPGCAWKKVKSGVKKTYRGLKKAAKVTGKYIAKGAKVAWKHRTAILAVGAFLPPPAGLVFGGLALVSGAYDAQNNFRKGKMTAGFLSIASIVPGGAGLKLATSAYRAQKLAKALKKPLPKSTAKPGSVRARARKHVDKAYQRQVAEAGRIAHRAHDQHRLALMLEITAMKMKVLGTIEKETYDPRRP